MVITRTRSRSQNAWTRAVRAVLGAGDAGGPSGGWAEQPAGRWAHACAGALCMSTVHAGRWAHACAWALCMPGLSPVLAS